MDYDARVLEIADFPLTHISALGDTSHKGVMGADNKAAEILQGTLELLILRTLATGAKHGYEVAEWIHTASADALDVEEGALYPALPRRSSAELDDAQREA
jgi:hypothetical protein